IDFNGEHQLGEDRSALKPEPAGFAVIDGHAQHVGRQQVAGELHALKRQPQGLRNRVRESGFAHSRNVFDQEVPARQQARETEPNLRVLAQDHPIDLGKNRIDLGLRRVHWPLSAVTLAIWVANCPISVRSSASLCRSLATTSAGAFLANSALLNLLSIFFRSMSALCCCFDRRASSAVGSIRPAMGTNISNVPTNATAEIGAAWAGPSGRGTPIPARRIKYGRLRSRYSVSLEEAFCSSTSSLRLGAMSNSPRICRTPSMKPITQRISGSASGSVLTSAALGKAHRMMVSPATPALTRTRCQISSLMNGASGCSARSSTSRLLIKVKRAPRFAAGPAVSDCSTAFES